MHLKLHKLQEFDSRNQEIRAAKQLQEGWEDLNRVFHHQNLHYIPKIICTKLINRYHNNPLASYFGIDKTKKLISQKYYWPSLRKDVEAYVKGCDVSLALKTVRHKPYGNLQSMPIPIHCWKDLLMDFMTGLLVSTNWKGQTYNLILVIVDWLTKMVYYKLLKVIINALGLAKVILDVVIQYHVLPNSIVTYWGFLFTFNFWTSLCYFLGIKQQLSTTFQTPIDRQTEYQKSTMKAYLCFFVNFK